jgi:hypothetical protein
LPTGPPGAKSIQADSSRGPAGGLPGRGGLPGARRPRSDAVAPRQAKLVQNGTLNTDEGFAHGTPTAEAEAINADLLAFIQS